EQHVQWRRPLTLARDGLVDRGAEVRAALRADELADAGPLGRALDGRDGSVVADLDPQLGFVEHHWIAGDGGHQVAGAAHEVEGGAARAGPLHVDGGGPADRPRSASGRTDDRARESARRVLEHELVDERRERLWLVALHRMSRAPDDLPERRREPAL